MADRVVLATQAAVQGQYQIVDVIKGYDRIGAPITDPIIRNDSKGTPPLPFRLEGGRTRLFVRDGPTSKWIDLGAISVKNADWLRQLVATLSIAGSRPPPGWPQSMQTSFDLSDAGWRQRIELVVPYLESKGQLAAQLAWGEMARAPYGALATVKSRVPAPLVASWFEDPRLVQLQPTIALLLGFVGDPNDAARLEQRIDAAGKSHAATNLAAILAADLELRGPSRVNWVEQTYFADRQRTMPEIEAAIRALSVHGSTNGTVPRERVIQAFRRLISERPPMAGFVVQQFAEWRYWGAAGDYAALLKTDAITDPASRLAIESYLQQSSAAQTALE